MITTTDAANILYTACKNIFGMPVYQAGNIPAGKVGKDGRVVIHTKEHTPGSTWKKGFIEVNLFVADTPHGNADLTRLNELERMATKSLKDMGWHDGTAYRFEVASTIPMENANLKAHCINTKVLFKVLNTME